MARTKSDAGTTSERSDVTFTMKMPPELLAFLDTAGPLVGAKTTAGILRTLAESLRTFFQVPPSMAELLRKDMEAKGLTFTTYMQELLLKRYHELYEGEPRRK